jgi:hypothetical protein
MNYVPRHSLQASEDKQCGKILVMSRAAPKSSRICPKKRGDCAPSGDRLSGVQVVLECVLLPFGALGDRHLGDPDGTS